MGQSFIHQNNETFAMRTCAKRQLEIAKILQISTPLSPLHLNSDSANFFIKIDLNDYKGIPRASVKGHVAFNCI